MKRRTLMKRLYKPSALVALMILALLFVGCQGVTIKQPEAPELASLAESVGETVIVFLPVEAHLYLPQWKEDVVALRAKLEAGDAIEAEWVKNIFADKLAGYLMIAVDTDNDLTEPQRQALKNDFRRSVGMVYIGGEVALTPDQATIVYGAVTGVLGGMALLGIQ
jgi:hypothetical protein